MFYPASDTIVDEYPQFSAQVIKLDVYLYECKGRLFDPSLYADAKGLDIHLTNKLIALYESRGIVKREDIVLCPRHRRQIEPQANGKYRCDECGKNYKLEQCLKDILYRPQKLSSKSNSPRITNNVQGHKVTQNDVLPFQIPETPKKELSESEATIKAAHIGGWYGLLVGIMGGLFAIAVFILGSRGSNDGQKIETPPTIQIEVTVKITPELEVTEIAYPTQDASGKITRP